MAKKSKSPEEPKPPASPDEIRRKFRIVAAATGTPSPNEVPALPTVDLRSTLGAMASECGKILHAAPIFRHALGLVTVDESGDMEMMTPERFCSWVEFHLSFVRWHKDEDDEWKSKPESIGRDTAGRLLAADQLRVHLRELKAIHTVRLPAGRGEGEARTVELAAPGYDPASHVFTLDTVPYQEDMPIEEAFCFLWENLRHFGWEAEGEPNGKKRRSFAAMLAAMVGVYTAGLFPPGTARPMIVFNGNQPGTGKSLLARMALCPVHGPIPESGKPENEAELEKVLDSVAFARRPFLLLDDVESLKSPALNKFCTSPMHEARRMHSQNLLSVHKTTQLFLTGNALTISPDLERRALLIDLFEAGRATEKTIPKGAEITNELLVQPETRAMFLAALWALVRHWRDAGMPAGPGRKPSFERWAAVVGGVVHSVSSLLADPFAVRNVLSGGDEATRALERVLAVLAGRYAMEDAPCPNCDEILAVAQEEDLLDTITNGAKDPRKSLGWRLKKIRGRHFTDTQGRLFEFGKRDISAGASYPIRYLSAGPSAS